MSKSRFGLAVAVAMAAGALGAGIPGQSANSERVMRALDNVEFSGGAPLHGAASAGTQGYASGGGKDEA